ncbi:hypothetical protein [uncultured Planktosalinus sp.]|mgnify:CR=1 FL=1|uniref:hypothetical protein n=1 Tax=uncultured Planktosalinus sp. TaxID=1810935 RepID=UPI0030D78244
MGNKSFIKDILALIPLILSGVLVITLGYLLWSKLNRTPEFISTLNSILNTALIVSGILAVVIMFYLATIVINLRNTRNSIVSDLDNVTQKMHNFRNIIDLLYRSKMWLPGLKQYLDEEYSNLNFFEVKEFYKGYSKLAIEFLQENHPYQDTENLYLEFKALLLTSPKEKIITENIRYPRHYDKAIVEKWLEHKCGSGLWYYFGYKFATYKSALDLEAVYERHQDKIMTLAQSIDSETFEDSSFNEVFLSKLGEYMNKDVIPKLHQFQTFAAQKLPKMVNYIFIIFITLVISGVLLPLVYQLFELHPFLAIISVSITIGIIFYITTSFYQFLTKEIEV